MITIHLFIYLFFAYLSDYDREVDITFFFLRFLFKKSRDFYFQSFLWNFLIYCNYLKTRQTTRTLIFSGNNEVLIQLQQSQNSFIKQTQKFIALIA